VYCLVAVPSVVQKRHKTKSVSLENSDMLYELVVAASSVVYERRETKCEPWLVVFIYLV